MSERVDLLESNGERPDLAGLRVLLVDDEPDTLEILRMMLSQFGANVRGAGSTTDAMNTFLEWKPDVLVSDLGRPEEDVYAEVARKLAEDRLFFVCGNVALGMAMLLCAWSIPRRLK